MKTAKNERPDAVAGQVDCLVRPVAWWRKSILPECLPCVTTCAGTAQEWRGDGHAVVELGDVAAERERWRVLLEARAAGCERAAENYEDPKFDAMARVLMSVREQGSRA